MANPLARERETALSAARAGGVVAMRHYTSGVVAWQKDPFQLVSQADIETEAAVVAEIRRTFPTHSILGEESHKDDAAADHCWVIDPIDGTNNFVHGVPQFAVSIAYCQRGVAQVGVVFNPARNEMYTAVRGQGATLNETPLAVGKQTSLAEVLVAVGFYYDRGPMMESTLCAIRDFFRASIHGIRRFGAASLDLCHVAAGQFGVFLEYDLSAWDFAAGKLIVEEAGGCVTTATGQPLQLTRTSVLASNCALHAAALDITRLNAPADGKPTNDD